MMKNTGNSGRKDNVIDMTERITKPDYREYLKNLKVRFDMEHAKVAISTSLLSIVILVTLANNNLMTTVTPAEQSESFEQTHTSRGIASVPGGSLTQASTIDVDDASVNAQSPRLLKELANRDLGPDASLGRAPSALEKLAFEILEGRYAVRLQDGIINEIELTEGSLEGAKRVGNPQAFINGQRALLPRYDRIVKVGSDREGLSQIETFQLVNEVSMPVAKVQVRMADDGRFVGMRVAQVHLGSK